MNNKYTYGGADATDFIDSLLDGTAPYRGSACNLYCTLTEMADVIMDNDMYHETFDELLMEYIHTPTERLFRQNEASGKWEPSSAAAKEIAYFLKNEIMKDYNSFTLLLDGKDLMAAVELF